MILNAEQESMVLSTYISTFRSRKDLKEFLQKYDIEYNKTLFNRTNIHKIKTIRDLLEVI